MHDTQGGGVKAARQLLSEKQRMDSADLANIWERHAAKDSEAHADLMRLWWEVDALRFELAGALDRVTEARKERDKLSGLYWQLQMRLPGGKV